MRRAGSDVRKPEKSLRELLHNSNYTKAAKRPACIIEIILTNSVRNIWKNAKWNPTYCAMTHFYTNSVRNIRENTRYSSTHKAGANRLFSHDVTAAILVSRNNETSAMLVSQTSPRGVELFFYANAFFCSKKLAYMLATWVKTPHLKANGHIWL